jgi:hypothetical protein
MTFAFLGNGLYTCKDTDTKETNVSEGSGCIEWNTGKLYVFTSGAWIPTLVNSTNIRLANEVIEPTASSSALPIYRHDIDTLNQAAYVSKLENGVVTKVRFF